VRWVDEDPENRYWRETPEAKELVKKRNEEFCQKNKDNCISANMKKATPKVWLWDKGLENSWQKEFEPNTKCIHCGANARIAFVMMEKGKGPFVCERFPNTGGKGGKYWPHDATAFALYLCEKCLEPTAHFNQA